MLGSTKGATSVEYVFEDHIKNAFIAEYKSGDKLIGVVGCNAAARTMRYASQLTEITTRTPV
jgi:tRNA U34 2-thiouridine synthase MnmA/TrmU